MGVLRVLKHPLLYICQRIQKLKNYTESMSNEKVKK